MSEHRGVRRSAVEIRAGLEHPVIDADGHWQEAVPVVVDALRDEGGPAAVANAERGTAPPSGTRWTGPGSTR